MGSGRFLSSWCRSFNFSHASNARRSLSKARSPLFILFGFTELHIQTFPALEMQLSAHHFAGEHLRVDSGKGQDRTLRLLSALWPPVFAGEQDVGPPKG